MNAIGFAFAISLQFVFLMVNLSCIFRVLLGLIGVVVWSVRKFGQAYLEDLCELKTKGLL